MRATNLQTEKRWWKPIDDPITFLTKQSFLKPVIKNKETRDWYLYGDHVDIVKPLIKKLFIIDGAKVRGAGFDDENVLIRMTADGALNRFKEIDYGK